MKLSDTQRRELKRLPRRHGLTNRTMRALENHGLVKCLWKARFDYWPMWEITPAGAAALES